MRSYTFNATIWKYHGDNAWYFITLPVEIADEIKALSSLHLLAKRGFGSLRVSVTIANSNWETSIFPDSKTGSYLLPLKKAIRTANHLSDGQVIEINLSILNL